MNSDKMEKQTWVYIKSEPRLWTVGFYRPDGKWEPESDHSTPEEAARQVNFLCGGSLPSLEAQRDALKERVRELEELAVLMSDQECDLWSGCEEPKSGGQFCPSCTARALLEKSTEK